MDTLSSTPERARPVISENLLGYARSLLIDIERNFNLPSYIHDDLQSAAYLGLCEAATRFDFTRDNISFKTFAYLRIRGAVFDILRKECSADLSSQHDPDIEPPQTPEEKYCKADLRRKLLRAIQDLPKDQQELIYRHYWVGEKYEVIAKDCGERSRAWVCRVIKRSHQTLRNVLT